MKDREKSKEIALLGIMTALLLVIFTLETVIGAIWITPPAVLSLTIVFVICFLGDWKIGFLSGVIFGVSSFIIALCVGNPLFILPWISILPRLFVGIGAYSVYRMMYKLTEKSIGKFSHEILPYSIGAGVGIIINTLTVLLALYFFAPSGYGNTFIGWVEAVITLNFPIELLAGIILTPVLIRPVKRFLERR